MVLGLPLLILLFIGSIKYLFKKFQNRFFIFLIAILLFVIQAFVTIDPISKSVFGTYKFGKYKMLRIGTEYLGDGAIYNTQYIYVQRLLDKFINSYHISSADTIFIDPYAWGTFQVGWGHFQKQQPNIVYNLDTMSTWPKKIYYLDFPILLYGPLDVKKIQLSFTPPVIPRDSILAKVDGLYSTSSNELLDISGYTVNIYTLVKK